MTPSSLLYASDPGTGVATITLNRPERLNALTFEIYDELRRTFRRCGHDREVRAVVVTGAGRAFCSGGDVHDIIGPLLSRGYRELLEFTRMTCDLVLAIRQCRAPVIAALEAEAQIQAALMTHADFREAYDAFVAKRRPKFL